MRTLFFLFLTPFSLLHAQEKEVLFEARAHTDAGLFTGGIEGPACDRDGNVYCVKFGSEDTLGITTPAGKAQLFLKLPEGSTANGIRIRPDGQLYVADYTAHQILLIHPQTKEIQTWVKEPKMSQPNDLTLAKDGSLYASDPDWKAGTGQIWHIPSKGKARLVAENMGTTNGIDLSPDGKTLYVNESVQRCVWSFRIKPDGSLEDKKLVREFPDFGFDGMRIDVEGNLYITRHGKGTVVKLSPSGEILREVSLLGKNPSNLCFGGPDGRTIYVTEMEHGQLLSFRVNAPGLEWARLHGKAK